MSGKAENNTVAIFLDEKLMNAVDVAFTQFAKRLFDLSSRQESTKGQIVELGGAAFLVQLVRVGKEESMLQSATAALASLCLGPERNAIVACGGLETLVTLLSVDHPDSVLASAATALQNLAREETYRVRIEELGGLARLVQLCTNSDDNELLANSAGALCNLADNEQNRIKIAALGGLEALVNLISNSQDDSVLENAAAALGNLADADLNRIRITEIGGLEPLVRMCTSSIHDGVLEAAAAAIANLAYNESTRKRIAKVGGIEPLIWLCSHSTCDPVLESAAAALGNIAYYNDPNKARIADLKGLEIMVRLLSVSVNERVLENVANAIRHLVYNNSANRNRLGQTGLLPLARLCVRTHSPILLESLLAVLRKAINSPALADEIVRSGAADSIYDLENIEGTVGSHASGVVRTIERFFSPPEWVPPLGSENPTVVFLSLASTDIERMEESIRERCVQRQMIEGPYDSNSFDPAHSQHLAAAKIDSAAMIKFLEERTDMDFIGHATFGFSTNDRDPVPTIQSFFNSEADIFVLLFSGGASEESGAWCFEDSLVGLWDLCVLWQEARVGSENEDARLIILSDSPYSGRWVDALEKINDPSVSCIKNIAINAACGPDELAYQLADGGGIFTNLFTQTTCHGESSKSTSPTTRLSLHPNQTPEMYAKYDPLSKHRSIVPIAAEHSPPISLLGKKLFTRMDDVQQL